MEKRLPEPHRLYRHYKGGLYEFISMAIHSETKEELVIYKSIHYGTVHARPLEQWFQEIPDTETSTQRHRFALE